MSDLSNEKALPLRSSLTVAEFTSVSAAVPMARTHRVAWPAWALTTCLFLAPLLIYAPTTFHDFGLRDDYSNLREAHEEPGKILSFCASHARPLYGLLLQASYGQTTSVQNLQWMRFLATLLLGTLAVVTYRSVRALGWSLNAGLCFALLVIMAPSSQVIAAWAVGWPYALAALLGVAGFFAAEGAMSPTNTRGRTAAQWAVALGLMVASVLIYQPSAMFYVVPLAAALIAQRARSAAQTVRWAAIHFALVAAALGCAYTLMSGLYAVGLFEKSGRVAFEQHWVDKMAWFLREALPNALSLFVLNDNNYREQGLYFTCAALAGLLLVGGVVMEWRRHGRDRGLVWLSGLLSLPICAFAISLVASERYATYRTILAMTAVLLCFMVASANALTEHLNAGVRKAIAATVLLIAFACAQYHPYALVAVAQGNEWNLIVEGAAHVNLREHKARIFAVTPTPADRSTESIYHDEFGSLSSNSEWVPKEMFKRAMHDLRPNIQNLEARYDFATGARIPAGQSFDVIIDLHHLRRFYTDN
jgi:Glucosyl transferase GtrII